MEEGAGDCFVGLHMRAEDAVVGGGTGEHLFGLGVRVVVMVVVVAYSPS